MQLTDNLIGSDISSEIDHLNEADDADDEGVDVAVDAKLRKNEHSCQSNFPPINRANILLRSRDSLGPYIRPFEPYNLKRLKTAVLTIPWLFLWAVNSVGNATQHIMEDSEK